MNAGQDQDQDHDDEDGDYLLIRCALNPTPCDRPLSLKQNKNNQIIVCKQNKQICNRRLIDANP
jgi:hypothetical protein